MNYEPLRNKFLLIDTNVLIDYSKYVNFFQPFIDDLKNHEISLVIDETVKFEFLRKASSPSNRKDLEIFLEELLESDVELSIDNNIIKDATFIANMYEWKKELKIDPIDCFLAAFMKKYNSSSIIPRLYLATQNHKHYPKFLFKRIGIESIDVSQDAIHNIGIYEFDLDNFLLVEKIYNAL